jgi:hypothetical protein
MELAARLAVLVACAVAAGALFILVATPTRMHRPAEPPVPAPLAGLAPAVLVAFILLAGGTALTGAAVVDAGAVSTALAIAGIVLLAGIGLVIARAAVRVLRAPTAGEVGLMPSPTLIVLTWAGAALALSSWLLAMGAVAVALLASVSIERPRA